jgi:lipopolysaccharide/colanic/teichoic acid biosynthesis glycosyltransferase
MTELTDANILIDTPISNIRSRLFWNDVIKRALDIIASALGLLFLAPVLALLALVIKRDSIGPVFYRGARMGRGDKPFLILKFRTMREDAASYSGPRLTAQDDERITPLGKWLRDTKLNELPQLWNVLKGEMSLVGPRPEDPELATTWPPEVRAQVLSVRPGITSPASVLYRDEEELLLTESLMNTYLGDILPSKLRLDQLYVRRRSLLLDLDVLFWTFLVLIPGLNRRKPPEDFLFWGLLSRFGKRYLNWFIVDTLTTLLAFTLAGLFWWAFDVLNVGFWNWNAVVFVAINAVIFSIAGALSGVQRIAWRYAAAEDALDLIPGTLVAGLVALGIDYFLAFVVPFEMILLASALAFVGYVFTRYRQRIVTGFLTRWFRSHDARQNLRERVLIIGSGETGQFAAWSFMNGNNARAFQVVGFVDDDMFKQDIRLRGVRVVGKHNEIPALVEKYDVDVIVYAIHNIPQAASDEILEICRRARARLIIWPDVLAFIRRGAASPETPQPFFESLWKDDNRYIRREQVHSWLDHLETQLHNGEIDALEEQIRSIRAQLQENN